MTLQGILHRGGTFFLLTKIIKRCLVWVNLLCCLGGAEENWRCLASYDLDVSFILGESRGSLVSLSVSGRANAVFSPRLIRMKFLRSGSMPNRCDAGSSSLRIGCLVDLGESACSQLVNGNGPQERQLAEKSRL